MRKIRVRDLDEWPPEAGGALAVRRMRRVDPVRSIVSTFIRRAGRRITFGCIVEGTSSVYHYDAKTENIGVRSAANSPPAQPLRRGDPIGSTSLALVPITRSTPIRGMAQSGRDGDK